MWVDSNPDGIKFKNNFDLATKDKIFTSKEAKELLKNHSYVVDKTEVIRYTIESLKVLKDELKKDWRENILRSNQEWTWADKSSIVRSIQYIANKEGNISQTHQKVLPQEAKLSWNINNGKRKKDELPKGISLNSFKKSSPNISIIWDSLSVWISWMNNPLANIWYTSQRILWTMQRYFNTNNWENKTKKMFVLAWTNDVVWNINPSSTINNIKKMAELARKYDIEFIPWLIPPMWKYLEGRKNKIPSFEEVVAKIKEINYFIKSTYPNYINYPEALQDKDNKNYLDKKYVSWDWIHLNSSWYALMRTLIVSKI
jgi:hypothetical protein